jgi:Protein of unknown function (DUF2800)
MDYPNDLASASQMWRHAKCKGNRILIRSLRDRQLIREVSTPEATVGTKIHAALEGLPEQLELTEQDVKDDCERLAKLILNETLGTARLEETLYEERFTYKIDGIPFFTGKPDRVYRTRYGLSNINFKTGRRESIASSLNLQLRTEVVLLYHHFKAWPIYAAIAEPLVSKEPEIVKYGKDELRQAEAEILEIVDATEWVSERKAGPWCGHCPARAFCPEAKALAIDQPLYFFTKALPRGEQGAQMLEHIETAYSILDKMWDEFKHIVQTELGSIPGWHISEGKNVRVLFPDKAAKLAADLVGTDYEENPYDLIETKMSVSALEKLMAKYWGITTTVKAFKKKFGETFKAAITYKQTEGGLERIPKKLLK